MPLGMNNAEYLRHLRARAVADGKCYSCRCRPAKPRARYCAECIDRAKDFEHRLVKERRCTNCCSNLPRGDRRLVCPGCRAEFKAKAEQMRAAWIAAGLCSYCGKQNAAPGRRQCIECAERTRIRILTYARRKGRGVKVGSCSVCTSMGLVGTGHDRRTHDRYMAKAKTWRP